MFTDRTLFPHQVTFMDLLLVALAAKALIDFWKESSLMAGCRAYFELRGGFWGELMECPFCLSYHACFWITALGRYLAAVLTDWAGIPLMMLLFILAAVSLTHLMFDITNLIMAANEADDDPDEINIVPIRDTHA